MTDKQEETNVILEQILSKEGGTLGLWGPVQRVWVGPPGPGGLPTGPTGPLGPDEVGGRIGAGGQSEKTGLFDFPGMAGGREEINDPLEAWAAANELMNRQGWTRAEKMRLWQKFHREYLPELEPRDRPAGGWMPDPSDLAGEDLQKLRDMAQDLARVVDVLTQKLEKLSDAAENVTVLSEPTE